MARGRWDDSSPGAMLYSCSCRHTAGAANSCRCCPVAVTGSASVRLGSGHTLRQPIGTYWRNRVLDRPRKINGTSLTIRDCALGLGHKGLSTDCLPELHGRSPRGKVR